MTTKHGRPAILAIPFDARLLDLGVHRALVLRTFESGRLSLGQAAKLGPTEAYATHFLEGLQR